MPNFDGAKGHIWRKESDVLSTFLPLSLLDFCRVDLVDMSRSPVAAGEGRGLPPASISPVVITECAMCT